MIVDTWMTRNPVVISPDTRIGDAGAIMAERRIRHLPVVDRERLVGVVTKSDLLGASASGLDPLSSAARGDASMLRPVHHVMSTHLATVLPTTPLEDAARVMVERKIGAVLVTADEDRLLGVLTESEAMRALIASISVDGEGARITIATRDAAAVTRFLVEQAPGLSMRLLSLLVIEGKDDPIVIARLAGGNIDRLVDQAWAAGHRVRNVVRLG